MVLCKSMKPRNSLILSISMFLALLGCSNNFTTKTNLDRDNFTDYFSSTSVKIYESEKAFTDTFLYVGIVEGEDCQRKAHHAKPSEVIARTNARQAAYKLKANAIIFTGCALVEDTHQSKQCLTTIVCYGKAYYISH